MTNEASGSDLRYVDRALQMFGIERSYMELASNAERAQALLRAMAVRGTDLEACAGMLERTGTGTKMPRPDECSEMTQSGYKAMQMLQPPGFDTLGDLDLTEVTSVSSLYDAVVGRPLRQEGHFGLVTTGAMTLSGATSSSWNDKNQGVQFGKHEEVWQVRSAPKGRIGKKLLPGELRKVVVLTRSTKRTDTVGRVSVIQLALLPPEAQQERPDSHRAAQTCRVRRGRGAAPQDARRPRPSRGQGRVSCRLLRLLVAAKGDAGHGPLWRDAAQLCGHARARRSPRRL